MTNFVHFSPTSPNPRFERTICKPILPVPVFAPVVQPLKANVEVQMQSSVEHDRLVQLIKWIDENTAGLVFPTDDRTMLAIGCFDVAIEHQAAIAFLISASIHGSAFALLRVLAESLVRGLWLQACATDAELAKFKRGKLDKTFQTLINEYELKIGTPSGVLSNFKTTAWEALNGFTHTGFHQVSRRHAPGRLEGSYQDIEIAKALGVAGALGMIAAGQLLAMSGRVHLLNGYNKKMIEYANSAL